MIALLDTSEDLLTAQNEIGCAIEQLLTPLTRFQRKNKEACFAIDNGAFAGFKKDAFLSLLEREKDSAQLCRFVAVPDVVASAGQLSERLLPMLEQWPAPGAEKLAGEQK